MSGARGICYGLLISLALWAAGILICSRCLGDTMCTPLRIEKARVIVSAYYAHEGRKSFRPWIGTLIREHERIACANNAPEFAGAWWWSLVYGGANADLKCYAVFPGNCTGPLDVKHRPLVLHPAENIRYHVGQMWTGYKRGHRGRGLCEYVMYPARPHDWGGGRFARTDARHHKAIRSAYRSGRLPDSLPFPGPRPAVTAGVRSQ